MQDARSFERSRRSLLGVVWKKGGRGLEGITSMWSRVLFVPHLVLGLARCKLETSGIGKPGGCSVMDRMLELSTIVVTLLLNDYLAKERKRDGWE